MSLWVETPEIFDTQSKNCLLHFTDPNWSLDSATWSGEAVVTLRLSRFPGSHPPRPLEVSVDCENLTATVQSSPVQSLSAIEMALEQALASAGRT